MIWRRFLKSPASAVDASWWQRADALAEQPEASLIDRLARDIASEEEASDEAERQHEMIEGLRQLLEVAAIASPPVVSTQHRVIGPDICHWVAPVSLADQVGAAGKLFVTSARFVLTTGRVHAWPWHRIHRIARQGRHLVVTVAGATDMLIVQCNTYGDALVVVHLAARFSK